MQESFSWWQCHVSSDGYSNLPQSPPTSIPPPPPLFPVPNKPYHWVVSVWTLSTMFTYLLNLSCLLLTKIQTHGRLTDWKAERHNFELTNEAQPSARPECHVGSTHKGVNSSARLNRHTIQQRPESSTVTLPCMHVNILHEGTVLHQTGYCHVGLVSVNSVLTRRTVLSVSQCGGVSDGTRPCIFTHMHWVRLNYRRRLRSLLLC